MKNSLYSSITPWLCQLFHSRYYIFNILLRIYNCGILKDSCNCCLGSLFPGRSWLFVAIFFLPQYFSGWIMFKIEICSALVFCKFGSKHQKHWTQLRWSWEWEKEFWMYRLRLASDPLWAKTSYLHHLRLVESYSWEDW